MSDRHPQQQPPPPAPPAAARPVDKRSLDERRQAAMIPGPSPDEMKAEHQASLEAMSKPAVPTPTQEEADAMKMGAYQQRAMGGGPAGTYQTR